MLTSSTLRSLLLFFILVSGSIFSGKAFTGYSDTSLHQLKDTAKIRQTRIINKAFDEVYYQNLKPSTFGREFFNTVPILLVGDITPNFVVFSTPKSRFFFVATPRVRSRLLNTYGAPVKSPSFMPGGTLYTRLNRDANNPEFLTLAYSHHSNGVRGPTLNPDGTINRDSGKFTTNFYTAYYNWGKRTDKGSLIINRYDALGIELHAGLINKGVAAGLKGHYGFVRINGNWVYNIAKRYPDPIDADRSYINNWQRVQFEFSYIADKYDNYNTFDVKKRLLVDLKYYYQLPFMQNVSFLVGGGYRGQDDYNIYFQDSYAYVFVGLAAGLSFDFHKN